MNEGGDKRYSGRDSETAGDYEELLAQETGSSRFAAPYGTIFVVVAGAWSLFQLWIASPLPFLTGIGLIDGVEARGLHLAFALVLGFLAFGLGHRAGIRRPTIVDLLLAGLGGLVAAYVWFNHAAIGERGGVMLTVPLGAIDIPVEAILGWTGIFVLLEAARRIIGLPLVVMCAVFILYSLFGQQMPDLIAHKGLSFERLAGNFWLGQEAIFGIPIDVSTRFIFLFVLFGALLDRAGAGQYFIDMSFGLVGRFRGGPAKGAVLASGMTGMISGSSIANVVTTGTFTIPVMKRSGMPAVKAGAIEVAASVDGQIMPPIMGAAAFVMAEFIGVSYFDVVRHAFLPAVLSYIALFYIVDIEAQKLNLKPMNREDIPSLRATFWRGAHFLLPLVLLVYLLIGARMTTGTAVFWATMLLMALILVQEWRRMPGLSGVLNGFRVLAEGLVAGARNMIAVAVAVAAAGIIVGAVASTGLSNALSGIVEQVAGGNAYLLLGLVAVLALVLGLGLPTTANYLVVASLMAPVIVEVGSAAGLDLPIIAVHLFVFYFGLMADVTPPVGLAAYAAAGISGADPIKTGVQAFYYSIRTAILPFIFIFNLNLLMIGIESWTHAALTIFASILAALCFVALSQRWMFTQLNWREMVLVLVAMVALFRPGFFMDFVSPQWQPVAADAFHKGVAADKLRLYVEQDTAYGIKRKLLTFVRDGEKIDFDTLGITGSWQPSGPFDLQVTDVRFMGPAETAGVAIGSHIVGAETLNPAPVAKEWVFVPALLLLLVTGLGNYRRAHRVASVSVH